MSSRPPDFDELVGAELDTAERDRLRRVHDLLVAAGPPADLAAWSPPAVAAETAPAPPRRGRRRRAALLALAAALGIVVAFTLGLVLAEGNGPALDETVVMSGPSGATASLEIYDIDEAGNWPMQLDVKGLRPASDGKLFQLWLTKDGEPAALCGSFQTDEDGRAVVPMNAPWRFDEFDGWVVVERGSTEPLLST